MKQEVFVKAYGVIKPIVLRAYREYYIQLWDLADMEQEAMLTLYKLLQTFPELDGDDDKLRRYFKTKFRNRLNDEVRRQESAKRQVHKKCYIEISDIAYAIPNSGLDTVDQLAYNQQVESFRSQLTTLEEVEQFDRLLAGERFKGRKKMIRRLRFWMVDFDPYCEDKEE